jgi:hypothetical protein
LCRAAGAIALLATGGIHLEQYLVAHYSVIPTIGPLFLVNFIVATALGLVLLVPIRESARRARSVLDSLAALAGIAVAAGALAALLISENTPLFGFTEYGYRLEIVIAIVSEAVAIAGLGVLMWIRARAPRAASTGSRRQSDPRSTPSTATGA